MSAITDLEAEASGLIAGAKTTADLRALELKYLGKNGSIAGLMRGIGALPSDERPAFGQSVNEAKARVQTLLDERVQSLRSGELEAQFEAEKLDVTMPGRRMHTGNAHVLGQAMDKVKRVMGGMGFVYDESPDLEEFKYNFDALNYPPDHPAMDDQDTFFIDDEHVMRTQTTSLQGRIFETVKPPLRYFTIGRCYRNEAVDRTHGHTFHQVDAFMVDEGVSMAHLRGTLSAFARAMFGEDIITRFRPDFFPFVEPGVDFAISSPKFEGGRWLELGGAGLIHPTILERYGIDTERYSGFAFGLGIDRIPLLAYGITTTFDISWTTTSGSWPSFPDKTMKFPFSMLLDFVVTDLPAEAIGDLLTMIGFELEEIELVDEEKVLDVSICSNRGDGLSVLGLAREVLAKLPNTQPTDLYERASRRFARPDEAAPSDLDVPVKIRTEACTRFAYRGFTGSYQWPWPLP